MNQAIISVNHCPKYMYLMSNKFAAVIAARVNAIPVVAKIMIKSGFPTSPLSFSCATSVGDTMIFFDFSFIQGNDIDCLGTNIEGVDGSSNTRFLFIQGNRIGSCLERGAASTPSSVKPNLMDNPYLPNPLDENGLADTGVAIEHDTFESGAQASVAWMSTRRNMEKDNARFIVSFYWHGSYSKIVSELTVEYSIILVLTVCDSVTQAKEIDNRSQQMSFTVTN